MLETGAKYNRQHIVHNFILCIHIYMYTMYVICMISEEFN